MSNVKDAALKSTQSTTVSGLMQSKHGTGGLTMADCKWMQDEICVNDQCPMCADYCPVVDYEGVCRYEERED